MRKPAVATLLSVLMLAVYALWAQQTIIITPGPPSKKMVLKGPLRIEVIPEVPGAPPSAPTITTASPLPDGDQDQSYSLNIAATGGTLPYSWSLFATETLPQGGQVWTPAGGSLAISETFGDPGCSATDNVWTTPAGLVIDNTGKLTGNCSGRVDGADSAVIENGIAASQTSISKELRYTTLPSSIATLLQIRSATTAQLCRLQYDATANMVRIWNSGGTLMDVFQPANDTRYEIEVKGERGVIAADAKCHARVATHNGTTYNAPGAWVESNNGTWTELIDNILLYFNHAGGVWYTDTYQRCQLGPVGDDACGGGAPDTYTTPSPVPNNVYVDNSTVPISETLWSHNGTNLTLEIATDPDLSTIEVAAKPGGTLALSQAGVLSGTPAASGTLNFTARVCDAVGSCSTKAFSLDINAPPDPPPSGPWISSFTPVRIHYVTPSGTGNGGIGTPEGFTTAVNNTHYQCGDLHVFRAGTYDFAAAFGDTNYYNFTVDCTSGSPAVFKGYVDPATGQPENAHWAKATNLYAGDWNWFVGIHLSNDVDGGTSLNSNLFRAAGVRLINGIVHDTDRGSAISPFSEGPGHVLYGMTVWRPGCSNSTAEANLRHAIYTQNDFAAYGWKYFVQNMILETTRNGTPPNQCGNYLFHAYSGGATPITGYHLQDNLFGDAPDSGRVMFGNDDRVPSSNMVLFRNYFVDFWAAGNPDFGLHLGRKQAFTGTITDNYFARAGVMAEGFYGATNAHDVFTFTGNEIYDPPGGNHITLFQTRNTAGTTGADKIANQEVWNNNTYGGTFRAKSLFCNGSTSTNLTLAQWRTATDACRVTPGSAGFDLNSTNPANPTVNKIVVLKNEYQCPTCPFTDQARGNIYIVNWENATSDEVDISSVVGAGKTYKVRYARDQYGTVAAEGTCPGSGACPVTLLLRRSSGEAATKFINAYVITGQP